METVNKFPDKSKTHEQEKVTGFTKGTKAVTVQQYKKEMWKMAKKMDGRRKMR